MLRLKTDANQNEECVRIDSLTLPEQKSSKKVLNKKDVTLLHLNNRNIRSLASLEDFPHLNCLCIDGNQLENLDFLRRNYSLGELYAGNNHISNIKGALSHLTNLRVLHLQNNQISNLKTLAYELRHLTGLEDLSLFDNPVTFARGYRSTIIDLLPKLRVLDRKTVSNEERARAFDECHPDRRKVLDQFAFAFHLETKPSNENPTKKKLPPQPTSSTTKPSVQIQETPKPQEQTLAEAVRNRALRRSVTEYSQFDWNKIPIGAEKRLMEAENQVIQPDVISIFFQ